MSVRHTEVEWTMGESPNLDYAPSATTWIETNVHLTGKKCIEEREAGSFAGEL